MLPRPPRPTLFPYTTLFRSLRIAELQAAYDRRRTELLDPADGHRPRDLFVDQGLNKARRGRTPSHRLRSEEHTSELQSQSNLVCRLLLEKKKPDPRLLPRFD